MEAQTEEVRPLRSVLEQRIKRLREHPSMARAVFRADTRLVDRLRCEARIRDLPPVVIERTVEFQRRAGRGEG